MQGVKSRYTEKKKSKQTKTHNNSAAKLFGPGKVCFKFRPCNGVIISNQANSSQEERTWYAALAVLIDALEASHRNTQLYSLTLHGGEGKPGSVIKPWPKEKWGRDRTCANLKPVLW